MSERRFVQARWVFPTDGEPIENGTVEIAEGTVVGISGRRAPNAEDLGNVALVPGLVNAHTHLEFSHLASPLPAGATFADWIAGVIAERGGRSSSVETSRRKGLDESRAAGVTGIGEIATSLWPSAEVSGAGSGGAGGAKLHIFREVLGLSPEGVSARLQDLETHLAEGASDPVGVARGISPHAPYSVHPELLDGAVGLARRYGATVAMHLAETAEELELLRSGTGTLVDLFRRMGIWRQGVIGQGKRPLDLLRQLAAAPRTLVIHGNFLDADEIAFVADRPQMTVVYCPQTHAYFRHPPHPLPRLLAAGARVALGTDSRASSHSLGLWEDLLVVRRAFPELAPSTLLDLATRNGADALGFPDLGRLAEGFPALLAVVALTDRGGTGGDPWGALLADGTWAGALPGR